MPPRSTIYNLSQETREDLDFRIVASGFGRYADHAAWLAGRGQAVSVAALQRYGRNLRKRVDADASLQSAATAAAIARIRHSAEMARALRQASGDDPLAISEQAAEVVIARIYEIATREDIDAKTLQGIVRSLNDSLRAVAAIRSEKDETARQQARHEAERRMSADGRKHGVSAVVIDAFRHVIEGGPEPAGEVKGISDETDAAIMDVLAPKPERAPPGTAS